MSNVKTPIKRVHFAPTDQHSLSVSTSTHLANSFNTNFQPTHTAIHRIYRQQSVTISVDYRNTQSAPCNSGTNTFYSSRKGNTFVLFNADANTTNWYIVTNNRRFRSAEPYTFQCNRNPNLKYRIGKCLTYFFHIQDSVSFKVQNRVFNSIRRLLLQQHKAIVARLKKESPSNRFTRTFIKFSHHTTTFYLGFHVPCYICAQPSACVMSRTRCYCRTHDHIEISTPMPPPPTSISTKGPCWTSINLKPSGSTIYSKRVVSKRLNLTYTKTLFMTSNRPTVRCHDVRYLEWPTVFGRPLTDFLADLLSKNALSASRYSCLNKRRTGLCRHLHLPTTTLWRMDHIRPSRHIKTVRS